jgi:hypothetical protein
MASISDEAAASAASAAGDRSQVFAAPKIFTMEPASFRTDKEGRTTGRYVASPGVYSQFRCETGVPYPLWGAPVCGECLMDLPWKGPPRKVGKLWVYRLGGCACRPRNFMRSPFRLVVGGDRRWWEDRNWRLHGAKD